MNRGRVKGPLIIFQGLKLYIKRQPRGAGDIPLIKRLKYVSCTNPIRLINFMWKDDPNLGGSLFDLNFSHTADNPPESKDLKCLKDTQRSDRRKSRRTRTGQMSFRWIDFVYRMMTITERSEESIYLYEMWRYDFKRQDSYTIQRNH